MSYTIRAIMRTGPRRLTELHTIATTDGVWAIATNAPLLFQTPEAAASYFRSDEFDTGWYRQLEPATVCYIEGPRGGWYHAASGKRMR